MHPTSDQLKAAEEATGYDCRCENNVCITCRLAQLLSEREAKARREGGEKICLSGEKESERIRTENSIEGVNDALTLMEMACRQALNDLK